LKRPCGRRRRLEYKRIEGFARRANPSLSSKSLHQERLKNGVEYVNLDGCYLRVGVARQHARRWILEPESDGFRYHF
jgi:hypothetical protein